MQQLMAVFLSVMLLLTGCLSENVNIDQQEHPLPEDNSVETGGSGESGTPEGSQPQTPEVPDSPEIVEPQWPREGDTLLTMTTEDMGQGLLILVNNQCFYNIPEGFDQQLITIAEGKSRSYRLKNYTDAVLPVTIEHLNAMMDDFVAQGGPTDIMVVSGWRTYELQEALFNNSAARNGLDHANRFVAKPKGSEHHTGYAVDLWSCNKGDYLDYIEPYTWITDHCNDYGFILRYEKDKEPITGIGEETWHYRYLGLPHSWLVTENGFCYEEYVDYLRGFPYEGDHLLYDGPDGRSYEVYFVEGLEVPVPESGNYEVSGNNVDGFIVTITK